MSVRTPDGLLAKSMQQGLPELNARLSNQQIEAEWWEPKLQASHDVSLDGKSESNSSDGGSGGQSQPDSQQQGQQNRRQFDQPDWLEEHLARRKSIQNGKQFTWHL